MTDPNSPALPIAAYRDEIVAAVARHPVVIVAGETGSGKTTQIPRYCLEAGRAAQQMIGCTQPRRVAATSVAERVAQETGTAPGSLIGWQHRFERCLSPATRVKFMTDGILLAETRHDRDLRRYDTLMIDEAHERTLNIDFLLGYLKLLLPRRPDLRVIVSSATLEVARFSEFFHGAPVIEVPGRTYPVELRYRPPGDDDDDLARMVADAADELCNAAPGDILVFLPGERDIRAAAETLRGRDLPATEILPLTASLPPGEQRRAFRVLPGRRRIVLSTNVAETSLTIPGIRMVIDSGLARISRYNHRTQVQRLHIEPVSQASAEQRKGRCGRLGPGICLRLYDEADFKRRDAHPIPEIRRTPLGGVILTMAELRLGRIEDFPFLDPPAPAMIREGYRELEELAAITPAGKLTALGHQLARMPVAPRLARMIVAGQREKSLQDVLTVVAALACEDPRLRPLDKQEAADQQHAAFKSSTSDFAGLLLLWRKHAEATAQLSRTALRRFCSDHFLSFRRMEAWVEIREQLQRIARSMEFDVASTVGGENGLHRSLLTGLFLQIGLRDPERNDYRGTRGLRFAIHPGSGLARKPPRWLMTAELVDTHRLYARRVAAINPDWIEPLARHLCRYSYHSLSWDAGVGTTRALKRVVLQGLVLAEGIRCDYSRIDPAASREMLIRHGLLTGDLPPPIPEPVRLNLDHIEQLRQAQHKTRGLIPFDDEVLFAACDRVLPPQIANFSDLRKWLARADHDTLHAFQLRLDLTPARSLSQTLYPDHIDLAGYRLPLGYCHDADAPEDGLTCSLPIGAIPLLRYWRADWLVPGLLQEKVAWMLSQLVRSQNRQMAGIAKALPQIMTQLEQPSAALAERLCAILRRQHGLVVSPDSWPAAEFPPHLQARFRIVDDQGAEIFATRDWPEVEEFYREFERLTSGSASDRPPDLAGEFAEVASLRDWSCGSLPEVQQLGQAGWPLRVYPALCDEGHPGSVALRRFSDRGQAAAAHAGGLLKLYTLALGRDFARLAGEGVLPRDVSLACLATGCDAAQLKPDATRAAIRAVLLPPTEPLPRDHETFRQRLEKRIAELRRVAREHWRAVQAALVLTVEREKELNALQLPAATVEDIHEQLAWLVFPGFARHVAPERLTHYGRYLDALRLRLQRARENATRDLERTGQLRPFWERYVAEVQNPEPARSAQLDDYRWAVEEYRVSLFAQELGTPAPVSPQRLDRLWQSYKVLTTVKGNRIPLEVTKKQRMILEKLKMPTIS